MVGSIYRVYFLGYSANFDAINPMKVWGPGIVLVLAGTVWCAWGGVEGTKKAWRFWMRGEEEDEARPDGGEGETERRAKDGLSEATATQRLTL